MGPAALPLLAALLARAAAEVPDAQGLELSDLAEDDACGAAGPGGEAACALNALQRRANRHYVEAKAEANMSTGSQASGHPMLNMNLFRAMSHEDLEHDFANVDLATIGGIVEFLHSDVVGEHVGNYDGYQSTRHVSARANNIDVIVQLRTRIKNPETVIAAVGQVDNFVDFAAFADFIDGEATGPQYNWNFGDIVGCQMGSDVRCPLSDPYYRISLSGYCPNLKFKDKARGAQAAMKHRRTSGEEPLETKAEATAEVLEEADEGNSSLVETGVEEGTGRRRRRHMSKAVCMTYAEAGSLPYGEILRGGLCPNGTEPGKVPTGQPGCIYTYDEPDESQDIVKLDDVVGITSEDCGDRKCKDYRDFRLHCSNRNYKKKFNYRSRRRYNTVLRSRLCIEYDIHKACARSCESRACQRVPANKREIGLPFWKGRCSAHANDVRAEKLAEAFNIAGATTAHNLNRWKAGETCLSFDPSSMCHPVPANGSRYCTRAWGGVCQPCWIPGANSSLPEDQQSTPQCPWSVLTERSDYANPSLHPLCASNLPRDLCCLYSSTCNSTLANETVLTEDGFAYVSAMQSTEVMAEFLQHLAFDRFQKNIASSARLSELAYWLWGISPRAASFDHVVAKLEHLA